MSDIFSYSGISTKARAMKGRLMKRPQYEQLASCENVKNALIFLKQQPGYEEVLKDFDENSSHRGLIESELSRSLYRDFNRLYSFGGGSQRKFLELYFIHFEAAFLKKELRRVYSGNTPEAGHTVMGDFIAKHSHLDAEKISASRSIDEFTDALRESPFYHPLNSIRNSESRTLYDYESALDVFFFSYMWTKKDKILGKKECSVLADGYGQRIDLLNIQWLMRAKKSYRMKPQEMYAMVIPCYYRLKPKDIAAIVEAASYEEAKAVIYGTYYGRRYGGVLGEIHSTEELYTDLITKIFRLASSKNPYSIAPINSYLYMKEEEITRITTIMEGIRYSLPLSKILEYSGVSG